MVPEKASMTGHGVVDPGDEDDDLVVREARGHDLFEGALHACAQILQHSAQHNRISFYKPRHKAKTGTVWEFLCEGMDTRDWHNIYVFFYSGAKVIAIFIATEINFCNFQQKLWFC